MGDKMISGVKRDRPKGKNRETEKEVGNRGQLEAKWRLGDKGNGRREKKEVKKIRVNYEELAIGGS